MIPVERDARRAGCVARRVEGNAVRLLLAQTPRIDLDFLARADERRGAPRLVGLAHRPAGLAVGPLIELPFAIAAELVELRETQQFATGNLVETETMDEA